MGMDQDQLGQDPMSASSSRHGNDKSKEQTTPDLPTTPPPPNVLDSHSWLFQSIMEIQKSVGGLTTKVDRLVDDVKDQGVHIERLSRQATFLKGWIAGAVVIVGIVVWMASSVLDHKWDTVIKTMDDFVKQQPVQPGKSTR